MNKKTEELKRYLKLYIGLFMCALGCIMISESRLGTFSLGRFTSRDF